MIYLFFSCFAAYLVGSIPTGYVFGKTLKGIDIRKHGSGNVGATNVFRTVGKAAGIVALIIDFLKWFVAVAVIPVFFRKFFPEAAMVQDDLVLVLSGSAAIVGHIWTVFLNFKGGKGVATTAGVMAGLAPWIVAGAIIIWVIVFAIWRYVSLASIIAAFSLPIFSVIAGKSLGFTIFCSILCLVGVVKHKANITRLLQGTENRIMLK